MLGRGYAAQVGLPRWTRSLVVAPAAGLGSLLLVHVVFSARGLHERWDCGASDCDTVGLGAAWLTLLFGLLGLLGGTPFAVWKAAGWVEILVRLGIWLALVVAAAFVIGAVWDLPAGHPAAR